MGDNVNHPTHYNQGKIEVIDAIEDWKLNFHLGNAVKYVARADAKGKAIEDLKKALWYIEREIQRRKCAGEMCSNCGWVGNSGTCECAGADPDELNGKKCPYWKPYDEPVSHDPKGKPAGQYKSDKEFLQWVYDRMVYVHLENPSYDYMHRFKKILDDKAHHDFCDGCGWFEPTEGRCNLCKDHDKWWDGTPQDAEQDAKEVATEEEVTMASALTDAFWRSQTVKMHDAELYDDPPTAVELFILWLNLTNYVIVKKDKLNGATKA